MIMPFNKMNVDISCLGNHEIEIGIEYGAEMIKQTNCPWVLSNMVELDKEERPLCGALPYKVLEAQGFKIGFMGFAEEAWLD
jgi:5'-nucleotidase